MASLKEIKTRIASVNSTRKITSAMKMVASSKLHHAQTAIQNMLPYENLLEHILKSFLISTPETNSPYEMVHGKSQRVALVVYTSNSSLCGGFNNNTIKMMLEIVAEYKAQGIDDIVIYPVGKADEEYTLSNDVHEIYSFVFAYSKVKTINYQGTTSEWNSVTKQTNWNYQNVVKTIHCTDGDISI